MPALNWKEEKTKTQLLYCLNAITPVDFLMFWFYSNRANFPLLNFRNESVDNYPGLICSILSIKSNQIKSILHAFMYEELNKLVTKSLKSSLADMREKTKFLILSTCHGQLVWMRNPCHQLSSKVIVPRKGSEKRKWWKIQMVV